MASRITRLSLVSLLLNVPFSLSTPSTATESACEAILQGLGGHVYYSNNQLYKEEVVDYFNKAIADLKPACVVLPTSAQEVSTVVKVLNTYPDVKFAVKSGGHDPNKGYASTNGGVLVAMRHLNGTRYDPEQNVAYVKPGGHWSGPIGTLAKDNVAVVGGRVGVVGIGGYLTQGGISYLSAQYGLAADNVVAFETVMADGSIKNITMDSDKDLMIAMRGAGANFGIVTQFTMRTYPMGKVWGGIRLFTPDQADAIFSALHDFVGHGTDPKAAVICVTMPFEFPLANGAVIILMMFYDGPKPPQGSFGKFLDVKPLLDTTGPTSYQDLLQFGIPVALSPLMDQIGGLVPPVRNSFRTQTIPWVEDNPGWYKEILHMHSNISKTYSKGQLVPLLGDVVFQPVQRSLSKQSAARGGNALGYEADDPPRLILEIHHEWMDASMDAMVAQVGEDFDVALEKQKAQVLSRMKPAEDGSAPYLPLFLNDAAAGQKVFDSWRNIDKVRELVKKHDPNGFWKRTGSPMV